MLDSCPEIIITLVIGMPTYIILLKHGRDKDSSNIDDEWDIHSDAQKRPKNRR